MDVRLVTFTLDDQRYAVMLERVERVIRAVEPTPLPEAPPIIPGVINLAGKVVPLVDVRKRLGMPGRELDPADHLIIARTPRRIVALAVDAVTGIMTCPEEAIVRAEQILPGLHTVGGIITLDDGLMLIYDIDRFLALEDERMLDQSLATTR
ncbi:MAG TPA: chemotaxis protein CheW [Bacteroidota bacterium]|nr:chemotaxis protein CheW [Bacteroidota bacterium]